MTLKPDHIDNAIASYLAGEAPPELRSLVDQWRMENENNRRYFEQMKLIFEQAKNQDAGPQFDTDRAWQKVRVKISDSSQTKTISFRPDYKVFMRMAAGFVMLLTTGLLTFYFFTAENTQILALTSGAQLKADTLPDGSAVYLNRATTIDYALDADNKKHVAKLTGEAYFSISHDDEKTFIVEAGETFIKDIGTSFNVKAYRDSATIEVLVEEGEVWFYTEGNPGIYLKANGKGIYNKMTGVFSVDAPEPNLTSYKTKVFTFNNQTVSSVVATVNSVYEKKIRIDDNLLTCKLTVSFYEETPEEIAAIIAETLGLTLSKSGNDIHLKGPGCGNATP